MHGLFYWVRQMVLVGFLGLLVSCGGGGGSAGGGGGGDDIQLPPGVPGDGDNVQPAAIWHTRKTGIKYPINAVARSATKMVAVTDTSAVLTSTDGHTWEGPIATGLWTFHDVVWGNNQFVAAGHFGYIATSPDGVTWTKRSECGFSCLDELTALAWSGSMYAAVGEAGMIYTSDDGVSWTKQSSGLNEYSDLKSVATSGSRFVAAGYDSSALQGVLLHSVDGTSWLQATITPATGYEFDRVIWDGSRFLATAWGYDAGIWTSADGTSWTRLTNNLISEITSTGAGAGYLGTNGVGRVSVSDDAVTWTPTYDFVHSGIDDILWLPDRNEYLVAGGLPGTSGFIATSADTAAWEARFTSDDITGVLWNGTDFVALDDTGRLFTSTDGLAWSSNVMIPSDGILRVYTDLAWSGSRYVAVSSGSIVSSADGVIWGNSFNLNSVAVVWAGTEFATITYNGAFYTSPTGIGWSGIQIADDARLSDLAWSDANGYVAVAAGGNIYTSATGDSWTLHAAAAPQNLRAVTWSGSRYVAVGDAGTVVTSADGGNWANHSVAGGPTFSDVTWTGSQFIAVATSGRIFVSADGVDWSEEATDTRAALAKIASGNGKAVAVGPLGRIISRP